MHNIPTYDGQEITPSMMDYAYINECSDSKVIICFQFYFFSILDLVVSTIKLIFLYMTSYKNYYLTNGCK